MTDNGSLDDFEAIKLRLEEIVTAVSDENIPLDDALDLYEEAVELGMRISDVLEDGIEVDAAAIDQPVASASSVAADEVAAE
ncbi:MAG: exodeoxyribonuclease VII small subunit [Eggerthellaceae bacterium]|nr:exodeoxyribonuclease VII small subunit [Eggerthellaceae bacterium]